MPDSASLENETHEIIESLGDISVKAIKENENAIAKKGINKITEIGLKFLELKSENEQKLSVPSSVVFFKPKSNQYISYIAEEIERTFQISLMEKNYNISRHIISQLHEILVTTLQNPNNYTILEKLVETRNYFGSLCFSLFKLTYENNASNIRSILEHHLINVPHFAISDPSYHLEYVTSFVQNHVYRVLKLIVDEDDLVSFKSIIDHYITSMVFHEPDSVANDIYNDLWFFTSINFPNQEFENMRDELQFMIRHTCIMNLDEIPILIEKLDLFKKLILDNSQDEQNRIQIETQFSEIFKKLIQFRVCYELSATLYRVSAYALFKNKPKFIQEFWYHIKPDNTHIVNPPLVPSSPNWTLLYTIYTGSGSAIIDDVDDYDFFQESKPSRELYAILFLFKIGKLISLPDEDQILKWSSEKKFYVLEYWYNLIHHYPVDNLLNSLKELRNHPKILEMLQGNEKIEDMDKKFNDFETLILEIKEKQPKILDLIDLHSPISNERFLEFKNREIKNYQEHSITENFKNIVYNKNLDEHNSKSIKQKINLPRDSLIPRSFLGVSFSISSHSMIAITETRTILNLLQSKIEKKVEETDDFLSQLNTSIQILIDSGFTPDVMFLPLDIKSHLSFKNYQYFDGGNFIFDKNFTLKIINSWNGLPFDNIIIFDSSKLQLEYESDSSERIHFTYLEENKEKPMIHVTAEMFFNIKIIDTNGFLRIYNPKIDELKNNFKK